MDNEPQAVPANSGISVSAQSVLPALASSATLDSGIARVGAQVQPSLASTPAQADAAALIGASDQSSLRVQAQQIQELAQTPQATIDTGKLKALLITLGHDIEAEWDHLIALAKKAL